MKSVMHRAVNSVVFSLLSCVALVFAGPADAQTAAWPQKPIRIITPYAPGFGFDVTLRRIAPALAQLLKQDVRVENRPIDEAKPGAGQLNAPEADGHTFVFANWTGKPAEAPTPGAVATRLVYEPNSEFVPLLRVAGAGYETVNDGIAKEATAQYAGFFAPPGTPGNIVANLHSAIQKVIAQDSLKAWTEVSGEQVSLVDGPAYTRFLEARRVHVKEVPLATVSR
jgi:tripartite-type tricarboxylate transporter receptor subunit TctC